MFSLPDTLDVSRSFQIPITSSRLGNADGGYESSRNQTAEFGRHFTIADVAALRANEIAHMSRSEMISVIRSVRDGHLRPELQERLPHMDAQMLRRLVFLTRRFCRNQFSNLGCDDHDLVNQFPWD